MNMNIKSSKMKYFRLTALFVVILMIFATFGACKKDDTKATETSYKTASARASAAKTSEAGKTSAATAVKSGEIAESGKTAATATTGTEKGTEIETGTEQTGTSETSEPGEGEDKPTGVEEAMEEKPIDLGGMTIDVDLIYQVRVPTEDNPVPARALEWQVSKEIEKKYNCKINYMVQYDGNDSRTLAALKEKALSGTENIEVQWVNVHNIIPSMVESGSYFLRIDDYIPRDSFAYENFVKDLTEWKGHGYGYCFLGRATGSTTCLMYNKEIMNRLGIDIWEQYVNKGIWTWENFLNVALAATQDFDGDGIVDQWGLKGWTEILVANAFIASNGGRIITFGDDGSVRYTLHEDPKAVKALQFMSDLYNIHKVTFVGGNVKDIMQKGYGAMTVISTGSFTTTYANDLASAKNFYVVPIPKGPDADKHIDRFLTSLNMMALPNIQGNPNGDVVRVMGELYAESHRRLGLSGETFDVVQVNAQICQSWFLNNLDAIPEFLDIIRIAAPPVIQNINLFNPLPSKLNSLVFNEIAKEAVPVTTKLMETKDVMQSCIDDVLN